MITFSARFCFPIHGLSTQNPTRSRFRSAKGLAPHPNFPVRGATLTKPLDMIANCAQTL